MARNELAFPRTRDMLALIANVFFPSDEYEEKDELNGAERGGEQKDSGSRNSFGGRSSDLVTRSIQCSGDGEPARQARQGQR